MYESNNKAVSPVIGVILMVAVTVALVALVTVVVFNLGGDVSDSPDATVQLEQSSNGVNATLLRNENVDYLYLQNANTSTTVPSSPTVSNSMTVAGDTESITASSGETVNVIAVLSDGSEEVLRSTEYQS
jgi:flagellin-like protein